MITVWTAVSGCLAFSGFLTAYTIVGCRVAAKRLPAIWAQVRDRWHVGSNQRAAVRWRVIALVAFWPWLLALASARDRLDRLAASGDPEGLRRRAQAAERELAAMRLARDKGIADAERELGMGLYALQFLPGPPDDTEPLP